jgi:hypothetical protein
MAFHRNLATTLLCVVLASLSLTACDQLRDKLASVIGSKSPDETLFSVRGNLDNGKFKEAKAEAEPFATKPGPRQADFALAAAQACGNLGEVSLAVDYLAIALKAGAVNPDTLMVDRNFESIRTDIRFVSLLTGQSSTASAGNATATAAPAPQTAPAAKAAEPATAIRMDSQAIEVKAGSISIKLPN